MTPEVSFCHSNGFFSICLIYITLISMVQLSSKPIAWNCMTHLFHLFSSRIVKPFHFQAFSSGRTCNNNALYSTRDNISTHKYQAFSRSWIVWAQKYQETMLNLFRQWKGSLVPWHHASSKSTDTGCGGKSGICLYTCYRVARPNSV